MKLLSNSAAALAMTLIVLASPATFAADLDEGGMGDFSGDRLAPTRFLLGIDHPQGFNVLSGRTGRTAGVVDVDYVHVVVPAGHVWTALRVGNQTTSGGAVGSFIGLARGATMPVPTASADRLLGWRHYSAADRNTDILDDMALPSGGASGFSRPLPAGDYSLWMQELAAGSYSYRFNAVLSPVPELAAAPMWLLGLAAMGVVAAARGRPRRVGTD